eukprot:GEMP01011173.1.p1 GENE.GEMP01011173.1~~GEMP01011173.1.p1  ORF type:complete len:461 (+),score=96.57 GEMP01011173.1:46-1383(+)
MADCLSCFSGITRLIRDFGTRRTRRSDVPLLKVPAEEPTSDESKTQIDSKVEDLDLCNAQNDEDVSAHSISPDSSPEYELRMWDSFALLAEFELGMSQLVPHEQPESEPGSQSDASSVAPIAFEVWLDEKVGRETIEMSDAIALALKDSLPNMPLIVRCNSVEELFDQEWNKLVSKFDDAAQETVLTIPKSERERKWDAIQHFVQKWSEFTVVDSAFHRYIWTLALQKVAKLDSKWKFPRKFSGPELIHATRIQEVHMMKLIESVDMWQDASQLGLHYFLPIPMLKKLAQRLASQAMQRVQSHQDTDMTILWFCICGRTWRQMASLVKTRAFMDYPYYEKLFNRDLTATPEKQVILEKNMYRFLQLGRVYMVVGILVLVGRHDDAENMLVQRQADPALRVLLRRLRLGLGTEDALADAASSEENRTAVSLQEDHKLFSPREKARG